MRAVAQELALKPPLKWAGGKRWQLPHLRSIWSSHGQKRLVEPFCGGLAVTLGLRPRRALLNDSNPYLIEFYRWLGRGLTIDVPLMNTADCYYAHRDRFNALLAADRGQTREAAALFYYLNRTGYNGLCRFNRQGEFNVPFGRYSRIPYQADLTPYREVVERWEFSHADFADLPLEDSDFVYADPPYDVEFTQYETRGFTWDDQERAAMHFARHRGPVILVNQATRRIAALYRKLGYRLRYLQAPRRISCTGDRRPAREVLATRNL